MAQGNDNKQIDSQELSSHEIERASGDASSTEDTREAASEPDSTEDGLYFFPEESVDELRARAILDSGTRDERAWVISNLLRYAQWDDIWTYVDRDDVRAIFEHLDLPDSLRAAWGRMLKIETPVGS